MSLERVNVKVKGINSHISSAYTPFGKGRPIDGRLGEVTSKFTLIIREAMILSKLPPLHRSETVF